MADLASGAVGSDNDRPHALAQIQFASMGDADLTPSEDETPEEKALQLETVQSAIGVSIGQQQTRLTSPKTPAAEKAAALDDTDGGVLFEGWEDPAGEQSPPRGRPHRHHSDDSDTNVGEEASKTPPELPPRLPSPWRASPKTFRKIDNHRATLGESFKARRRTMSGSNMNESLKKYLPFNLPSMPKTSGLLNFSLPSFSVSSFDQVRGRPGAVARHKQVKSLNSPTQYPSIAQHDGSAQSKVERVRSISRRRSRSPPRHPATAPLPQHEFGTDTEHSFGPEAPPHEHHRRSAPALRRSNSEGSLLLYRSRSFASSLGDDSRFENVSEQVNSRLKAIKDSWQDSNFKLSVPSLPNFGFGSRDDFFRSKNGPPTPRSPNADTGVNHRVTFLANSSNTSSRRNSVRLPKAKLAAADPAGMYAATHPHFTRALSELQGDLVILGGYRGSVLRSAEPPNRQLWVPIKVGLNLRKVDLEVGLEPEDEERMEETIIPGGMLTHIGPVDIAKRLLKRLRASENAKNGLLRVHDYGYDWRLSPHLLSRRLIKFLEGLPCNQPGVPPEQRGAIVVAHSLGGLLTRHAINQRPELVSGVVYAGVPQNCINILGPLRNGDDVLLSSRVLTAQVNFTIRTSYALLPLDGKCFINKYTKEEYPVDFFDIKTWEEYRLSPCIAPPLPVVNPRPDPNASSLSVSGLINAMSQALPSISSRKGSLSKGAGPPTLTHQNSAGSNNSNNTVSHPDGAMRDTASNTAGKILEGSAQAAGMEPHMQSDPNLHSQPGPSTTVTIPHDKAVAYLTRTLAETKAFKQELDHHPEHTEANAYPPIALIYGKSTPTVYGAKVENRDAIKRTGAYDELAFASGDGVVLARAAMVPPGYHVVRGGVVPSERGHVTLLGDLEAVGKCLNAVIMARKNGVGLGVEMKRWRESEKLDKEERAELDDVKG
ncbi:hypothetical protein K458DRAFT_446846 [Lentithecium fluviatile CBS 122367]|uniref:Alpha/beta-hydrolase n=1 Tax=Lentithecium fluviatile CBS 122367 TaxID=1168545 RepID=A0A6G1IIG1_9PLEO|nr:hypothetical protein K458DRAFT_446846 [Lentithecium fluviatile CBS 122367]